MSTLDSSLWLGAAAGADSKLYVEDVFNTFLYTGSGSTQAITNGIDLSDKGGMVWVKERNASTYGHSLLDTLRGKNKSIQTHTTNSETLITNSLSFQNTGFLLGSDDFNYVNKASTTYASWTFRKAPGFFDVVTYAGNSQSSNTISHSLGSAPGAIIIKAVTQAGDWVTLIRKNTSSYAAAYLNLENSANDLPLTEASATTVNVGRLTSTYGYNTNTNGISYVAYLFAHDAGGFGDSGNESVIKCGSYTGDNSSDRLIHLGWEAQWVLIKPNTGTAEWRIYDTMRGVPTSGGSNTLAPNTVNGENNNAGNSMLYPDPLGFRVNLAGSSWANLANTDYIYIAIRRAPMKTPTDASKVLRANTRTGTGADTSVTGIGFAPDLAVTKTRTSGTQNNGALWFDRLRGNYKHLASASTNAEGGNTTGYALSGTTQGTADIVQLNNINRAGDTAVDWFFRRAPGFFDVVCYTGNGLDNRQLPHGLGVTPELVITRNRTYSPIDWAVDHKDLATDQHLTLNQGSSVYTAAVFGNHTATNVVFGTAGFLLANYATHNFVAYLFASCPGVSKVGSYTGTGFTSQNIDCGFTASARFVMIKRTDAAGDWYVFDAARGIKPSPGAGNTTPYLLINLPEAEVADQDYIMSSGGGGSPQNGFYVYGASAWNTINVSSGTYIFLAIA